MSTNILIIGETSFLASGIYQQCIGNPHINLTRVSHSNLPDSYAGFDWVINCAFNNELYSTEININNNFDFHIIHAIKKYKNIKYLFLSSRAVYGNHFQLIKFDESFEAESHSITQYGLNKLECEDMILNELGESRVLICRCANITGIRTGTNFLGIAQESLMRSNEIILDISKNVVKDFLPLPSFSLAIESLVVNNIVGVYNIGSGIGLSLEELCRSLIAGYGGGLIKEGSNIMNDQFILDISNLKEAINFTITKESILSYIYFIGQSLKEKSHGI